MEIKVLMHDNDKGMMTLLSLYGDAEQIIIDH